MKIRFYTIIYLSLFTVCGNAQSILMEYRQPGFKNTSAIDYHELLPSQFDFKSTAQKSLLQSTTGMKYPSLNHLPGLFCKLEYKIELKSKLAPRFRLGSLQYTEWMEGKQLYFP